MCDVDGENNFMITYYSLNVYIDNRRENYYSSKIISTKRWTIYLIFSYFYFSFSVNYYI